jgi:hypothetical protein
MRTTRIGFKNNGGPGELAFVGPSTNRVALTLFGAKGESTTYNIGPIGTAGNGIRVDGPSPPVTLTVEEHGEIVQEGWIAKQESGLSAHSWLEVFA